MAKLYFYYAAMNAGKSTALLQSNYNYRERGMDTILFTPNVDTRYGVGKVSSRIGIQSDALKVNKKTDLLKYTKELLANNRKISCVFVDEAQFLNKVQIEQLTGIVDELKIPVLAYGLRTSFTGEPFEGSLYLLAWADKLIELKTICHCGKKATMNVRIDENGNKITQGEQIMIGGNEQYIATCRAHFKSGKTGINTICEQLRIESMFAS